MTLIWDFPALATWKALGLPDAFAVARAVVRLAETGEGAVRFAPPYFWLHAGRYDLKLAIDPEAGTICVLNIYRARAR